MDQSQGIKFDAITNMVVCIDLYCHHTAGCLVQYFQYLSSLRVDNANVIWWCSYMVGTQGGTLCISLMLGMSNFSKDSCVFGDVSTGVNVGEALYAL